MSARAAFALASMLSCGCGGVVWYGLDPDRTTSIRIVEQLGEQFVEVGGLEGPAFDGIAPSSLATTAGPHVAYAAREGDEWWVVIDGEAVLAARAVQALRWEASGNILVAVLEDATGVRVVELSRDESGWRTRTGPPLDAVAKESFVASTGGCVGYVGFRGRKALVVLDGVVGPELDAVAWLRVSPTCSASYAGRSEEGAWLFRDGLTIGPFEDVAEVATDPSGARVVALVREKGAWFVDDGGARSLGYESIGDVTLSSDGATLAYRAERDGNAFVVDDGVESGPFREVKPRTLRVAGPSGRVAFVIRAGNQERVVVDALVSEPVDAVEELVVSADGTVAFVAREGEAHRVVAAGIVLGEWEWAGDLQLTKAGQAVFMTREGARDVVHAGPSTFVYEHLLRESLLVGRDGVTWGALAVADGQLVLVHASGIGPSLDLEELAGEVQRQGALDLPKVWVQRWMTAELARVASPVDQKRTVE